MGVNDRVNILLVDDQPARLLTYQSILSDLGQNLVFAHSGTEALDKLMRDEFAVVLLDVSMPEMDGFEAAELIHAHPRFEKTPIIFVTGIHVSELDRLRGYKAGAVDYVAIPVVPEILRSKVAVLVELTASAASCASSTAFWRTPTSSSRKPTSRCRPRKRASWRP